MMRMVGPALRAGVDPFWPYVALLMQGGVMQNLADFPAGIGVGSSVSGSSGEWTYNGMPGFKFLGTDSGSSLRFSGLPLFGQLDWTWEIAWRATAAGSFWWSDGVGNTAGGLRLKLGDASGDRTLDFRTNTGVAEPNGQRNGGGVALVGPAYPIEAYLCAERVGRYIYLSSNGVVTEVIDLGSPGYAINAPERTPRIGQQTAVAVNWVAYAGQFRLTLGAARYAGQNFAPPTGPYPIG